MAKQNPCPVPGCQRNKSLTSKFGVCAVHDSQFAGITFYLQQAQKQAQQATRKGFRPGDRVSPGGLIIP